MANPRFSQGADEATLKTALNDLVQKERPWQLCANGQGVERVFKFKTFKAAWAFMGTIAASCKSERHHPEWSNTYNRVFVRWTTHNPEGLSEKDVRMAALCDEVAGRPETLEVTDEDAGPKASLSQTADRAASAAGDCCSPNQKQDPNESERQEVEAVEKEEGAAGSVAGMGGQPS